MNQYTIYLKDLLQLRNLSDVLSLYPRSDFREFLGKPDKEIHAYSEVVKVYYGNYELEIHRRNSSLLKAKNMHPDPAYPVDFQQYLHYENDSFQILTDGFVTEKDISWAKFKKKLQLKKHLYYFKEQSESKFVIQLHNEIQCSFIGESVHWIHDEQGKKTDYQEIHFDTQEDFILNGIFCNFY